MKNEDNNENTFFYKEGKIIKMVRPWALIITLGYFLLAMTLDGNWGEFAIRDVYLNILENILITMIAFLYGSRGVEKVSQIIHKKKQDTINVDNSNTNFSEK